MRKLRIYDWGIGIQLCEITQVRQDIKAQKRLFSFTLESSKKF